MLLTHKRWFRQHSLPAIAKPGLVFRQKTPQMGALQGRKCQRALSLPRCECDRVEAEKKQTFGAHANAAILIHEVLIYLNCCYISTNKKRKRQRFYKVLLVALYRISEPTI